MSMFWSIWVIVITLIVLLGSVWLLFATRKITVVDAKSADADNEETMVSTIVTMINPQRINLNQNHSY